MLDKFFLKYERRVKLTTPHPHPPEKTTSKSPALLRLRCSRILNFCVSYVHTDSGKPTKSQGKLFFPFNFVNASLKYQHQLQQKL